MKITSLLGKSKNQSKSNKRNRVTWKEQLVESERHKETSTPTVNTINLADKNQININTADTYVNGNDTNTPASIVTITNTDANRPTHWWPPNITSVITTILATPAPIPQPTLFTFELTNEAASRNLCILKRFNRNLQQAIDAQPNSPISYGSEFRSPITLAPLFEHHPNWTRLRQLLSNGSIWPLASIPEESRQDDLNQAIEFGNHKGATTNPDLLVQLINEDVIQGFILPLPLSKISHIPGILIAPMNIVNQDTIDDNGSIIPKNRLTHDQSFIFDGSNTSVNSRLDKSELEPCIFGWAIRQLINWTVAARRKHPNCKIYATKTDFKSAYRKCHMNSTTALQSCSQLPEQDIALIALRLTFGGAACPYEWSIISETICDLATVIAHDDNWDPTNLHSPDQELIPPPISSSTSTSTTKGHTKCTLTIWSDWELTSRAQTTQRYQRPLPSWQYTRAPAPSTSSNQSPALPWYQHQN